MKENLLSSISIVERLPLSIILEILELIKTLMPSLTADQRIKVGTLFLCFAEKSLTGGDLLTSYCLEAIQSGKDTTSADYLEGMLLTFYSSVKSTNNNKGEAVQ